VKGINECHIIPEAHSHPVASALSLSQSCLPAPGEEKNELWEAWVTLQVGFVL